MKDAEEVHAEDIGRNIEAAFRYVQQIFKETAQLMRTLDRLMGKE